MPKKLACRPPSRKLSSGDPVMLRAASEEMKRWNADADLFAPFGEDLDRLGAQLIRLFPEHGLQAPSFASMRPEHVELVQQHVREMLVSHLPAADSGRVWEGWPLRRPAPPRRRKAARTIAAGGSPNARVVVDIGWCIRHGGAESRLISAAEPIDPRGDVHQCFRAEPRVDGSRSERTAVIRLRRSPSREAKCQETHGTGRTRRGPVPHRRA